MRLDRHLVSDLEGIEVSKDHSEKVVLYWNGGENSFEPKREIEVTVFERGQYVQRLWIVRETQVESGSHPGVCLVLNRHGCEGKIWFANSRTIPSDITTPV